MVSAEFYLTKHNHTKARSYFNGLCIRQTRRFLIFLALIIGLLASLSFQPHVSAVEWQEPQTTSGWKGFWGQRDDDSIYLGMWTRHLLPGSNDRLNNVNRLIGVNYKGIFFATFLNSHSDRSYTLGIQRIVYSVKTDSHLQFDAGYRLGLIYGYKSNSPIASLKSSIPGIENLSPIPFGQIIFNVSWEMVGVQFSWCWAILTAGFYVKF